MRTRERRRRCLLSGEVRRPTVLLLPRQPHCHLYDGTTHARHRPLSFTSCRSAESRIVLTAPLLWPSRGNKPHTPPTVTSCCSAGSRSLRMACSSSAVRTSKYFLKYLRRAAPPRHIERASDDRRFHHDEERVKLRRVMLWLWSLWRRGAVLLAHLRLELGREAVVAHVRVDQVHLLEVPPVTCAPTTTTRKTQRRERGGECSTRHAARGTRARRRVKHARRETRARRRASESDTRASVEKKRHTPELKINQVKHRRASNTGRPAEAAGPPKERGVRVTSARVCRGGPGGREPRHACADEAAPPCHSLPQTATARAERATTTCARAESARTPSCWRRGRRRGSTRSR